MEPSAERVAYDLMLCVAYCEAKDLGSGSGGDRPSRQWILDTYAECLVTVRLRSYRAGEI